MSIINKVPYPPIQNSTPSPAIKIEILLPVVGEQQVLFRGSFVVLTHLAWPAHAGFFSLEDFPMPRFELSNGCHGNAHFASASAGCSCEG